jgi:hypothetical protein
LPVPAGPIPKLTVCAPPPGQDVEREDVGRTLLGALLEHADDAADGISVECLALVDELEQLGEDPLSQRIVGR